MKKFLFPLAAAFLWNQAVYCGARLLTQGRPHYDLTTSLDRMIPVIPATLFIYLGCFLWWAVQYLFICRQKDDHAARFLSADLFSKTVCLIFFLILPTANIRPVLEISGFWENALRLLYLLDAPDNLFPSIHCLISWLCYVGVRKSASIPKGWQLFSLVMAVSVCLSTLTTRQHVIADVLGGILLAEFSFWFVHVSRLDVHYARFFFRNETI